ncbi:MAG: flagellar motor protein MotB [Hyphomicrobiaceae bacterium]
MSVGQEDAASKEIVIIRRRGGGHDDGHHGGAWKIAYADFMTAMMAFFLVMWLVNAANEETKSRVASYFNPLRLTDRVSGPKGIKKLKPDNKNIPEAASQADETLTHDKSSQRNRSKQPGALKAKDRYLKSAAKSVSTEPRENSESPVFTDKRNHVLGPTVLDPFEIPRSLPEGPHDTLKASDKPAERARLDAPATGVLPDAKPEMKSVSGYDRSVLEPKGGRSETAAQSRLAEPGAVAAEQASDQQDTKTEPAKAKTDKKAVEIAAAKKPSWEPIVKPQSKQEPSDGETTERDLQQRREAVQQMRESIANIMAQQFENDLGPSFEVGMKRGGLLISLTDNANYGMFTTGSTKPDKSLIRLMRSLAGVIQKHKGAIIVSGHTDAHPYRTNRYDNWRLSFDRAYEIMKLLRTGENEVAKFARIEGHAAQSLKSPNSPFAAENRRVEILLK